eukprot:801371_1
MKLLQQETQTLNDQLLSAQAQAKQRKTALTLQNETNERLQHEIQQKDDEIDSFKSERDAIATQFREKDESIRTLKLEKESLKQENASHEKRSSVIQKEKQETDVILAQKENEIVALNKQIYRWKQSEEERKQTQDQHNKAIHAKEEEIRRLESELEAKQRDLYQKEKEHQMLLDASQAEVNTLKEQLQSAQRETLEKAELGTQYQNAMRRVEGINKEHNRTISRLQEKLQSAQTETENEKVIESLKSEIATNATQREEKENEDAMSLKQAKDDGLNTQKELERVNTKYNELEKDQEALNTKHRQNQQRIEELMAKTKLLESKESEYHKEHEADTKQKDETIHDLR